MTNFIPLKLQPIAPGDKVVMVPTRTGNIAVKLDTIAPGDKTVMIPTSTGNIVVKLNPVALGDKALLVPLKGKVTSKFPPTSIIIMGGYPLTNDVWGSTDKGITWTQITASAGWIPRYRHSSVKMPDGSIILMGGRD